MIYLDTETCGFHGVPVLLQYSIDRGPIELYELWRNRIGDTIDIINLIVSHPGGICGFNLTFDWFHIVKWHTMMLKVVETYGPESLDWIPEEHIIEIALCEKDARDGPCVKPVTALDLFLEARKGKYQSTLDRKDIRIRRVPTALVYKLADRLNTLIPINPLYFARRKTRLDNPWQVHDIVDKDSERVNGNFKDIVLKFSPSAALKAIAADAGLADKKDILKFSDVEISKELYPTEYGWAPFAEAVEELKLGQRPVHSWPAYVKYHIDHWAYKERARIYAADDVKYLHGLHDYFGNIPPGDDDSLLACCVAAVRWRGYSVNIPEMERLLAETVSKTKAAPTSPSRVKEWIRQDLDDIELMSLGKGTGKKVLEAVAKWRLGCDDCGHDGCKKCPHPAALKAQAVLEARSATKEKELYVKILQAGRLHAGFKVIGALSTRMSGDNKLNPQGIKSTERVRKCFTLGDPDHPLCGGDMESFEVVIALAVYNDEQLERDLQEMGLCSECAGETKIKVKKLGTFVTCPECNGSGQSKKKIHGVFGSVLYEKSYDDIIRTKGTEEDLYKRAKSGLFAMFYGGNENTLMERLSLSLEAATRGAQRFRSRYPGVGLAQKRIYDMFCSMRQEGGLGTRITWKEPADFIPSLLGFRRYFTLENRICRTLFDLAENPPKEWTNLKIRVRRRDRDQTASGAVRSALFGAAFGIQGQNLRAATNHEIQSTGAGITKRCQVEVWNLQPPGVHEWIVQPMNIHDEILTPTKRGYQELAEKAVRDQVEKFRPLVPLISIAWKNDLNDWSEKG